jgi:nitronate monooxygenase
MPLKTSLTALLGNPASDPVDVAAVVAGEAVGLSHDIPPAAEIVERIVSEADQMLRGQRNSSAALQA